MATGPTITAKFLADTSQMTGEVDKATSTAGTKISGFAKNAAVVLGGAFVVDKIVDFGKASVEAAAADAEGQAKLAQALKTTTGATDAQVAGAEKFISNLSKSAAIADDDLRPALATLARGFGSTEEAQKALSLATDVSAGTGKDLSSVTEAMMKAAQGNTGALKKMGVETKNADGSAKSLDQIMADMSKTFSGQAATAAESTAGQIRGAKIAMGEMQEQIGTALLPVLGGLATFLTGTLFPALSTAFGWIMDNKDVVIAAIVGVGAVVMPLFISWAIAAGSAALATLAAAAPFIAIAAVIAGVAFLIIHNWDTIVAATKAAWDAVTGAVQAAFNWVRDNWPLLLAIITGPIGAAVLVVVKNWDTIKAAAQAVWNWITGTWSTISGYIIAPIQTAKDVIVGLWNGIKDAATGAYNWVKDKFDAMGDAIEAVIGGIKTAVTNIVNAIKNPINAVIRAWNGLEFHIPTFTLPSVDVGPIHFGGQTIGGQTIGFPDLPQLAEGGLITSTGLVYAHAGEAIGPIDRFPSGPAVHIEHATFTTGVDVDLLMDRVAWAVRTRTA